MPIEIRYIDYGLGIELVGLGHVTGREICNALHEIYSGDSLKKQRYQVWCFTGVDHFDFPKKDFHRMVSLDKQASQSNPEIVVAVVGEENMIFGISRMWETHMTIEDSRFKTMTFRKREDADAWLNSMIKTN